jgi:hypothetical protein
MRRLVSLLCLFSITACGGGGSRSALPGASGAQLGAPHGIRGTSAIGISTSSIAFTSTDLNTVRVVQTTWDDDTRKAAVSSDPLVVDVSPPFQQALCLAPGVCGATYFVTPLNAGTATITFSDHDGAEHIDLHITVTAPPTGTLYVAGLGEVDAFPAATDGSALPARRITGFFTPFSDPQDTVSAAGAVSVGVDGTLYVVRNYLAGPYNPACEVIEESATATGTSGVQRKYACAGRPGLGIAPGSSGEVDVVVDGTWGGVKVQRFGNGLLRSTLNAIGTVAAPGGLATDSSGNIFVSSTKVSRTITSQVLEYAAGAPDGATPTRTIAAPAGGVFGAIAVAPPDGTIYAVYVAPNLTGRPEASIYAYAPGSALPSRKIGPFGTDVVTSLACDRGGELFVALNTLLPISSRVAVYAPAADGNAFPIRTIPNPIPADAPGGGAIVAIGLSPPDAPPPQVILSRRRQQH